MCVAASLTGCGSSARIHIAAPATRLSEFKTALVQGSSDVEGATKEAIQLEATVAMIAREIVPFQQVLTKRNVPDARVDLRVEARIVLLKKVTAESRAARGMLAGRARVAADVVLIEVTTGAVVGRFTVEGQSSGVGTTEQAIRRASEQLVAFVLARFNG